ncbi:MAG: hypothetical protein HC903_25155 [Methylacidiphilales bacterium]|nr:hypothetical protein [Candidatus Methylacidiphilales bacterium]NJR18367.1 hypothetical protein [Calothrix sp. CSU_2_0]
MTEQNNEERNKQSNEEYTQLKIQKGIRQQEDRLVIWIQEALDKKSSYGDLEESQFRNVLRVAETTDSPEVIKNFLRYQVGRDKKWGRGKDSLAEKIVTDIGIEEQGGRLLELASEIAKDAGSDDMPLIWIELIRRYLGYGSRYLKYLRDGQKI